MISTLRLHSITVEPLTDCLRHEANLHADPNHLAIVERANGGHLLSVRATTADYDEAYPLAHRYSQTTGARVLTMSSYGPTVVGADVADHVKAEKHCQPLDVVEDQWNNVGRFCTIDAASGRVWRVQAAASGSSYVVRNVETGESRTVPHRQLSNLY